MPSDGTVLASAWVAGAPKTKGSLDFIPGRKCKCCAACNAHVPGGHVAEGVIGSKRWRNLVAEAVRMCQRQLRTTKYEGAVTVCATFYLPVKSVIAARAGDLDKLLRNALDALQDAGTYSDDTQVVRIVTDKREATDQYPKGLSLLVLAGRV